MLDKNAGEVIKNTFFYRTPPVAAFVVFATKQLNIQCYNDNFGLYYNQRLSWKYRNYYHPSYIKISIYQKYAHLLQKFCNLSHLLFPSPNFLILSSIYLCIISIFLRGSGGVSHSYTVSLIEGLSKINCPIYQEENSEMFLKLLPETIHLVNKNHNVIIMLTKTSAIQSGL